MPKERIAIINWEQVLKEGDIDPEVNIRITPLTKNPSFAMYVTEIAPASKVGAHYHQEGIEVYEILRGKGRLYTALPDISNIPTSIVSQQVTAGDFFEIPPGCIHQLANIGDEPLILIFGCPATHLSSDRIITNDLMTWCMQNDSGSRPET